VFASLRRYRFRKATVVSTAAIYALLASFAMDVYVLCVHQDGHSHIELSHDITDLMSDSDTKAVLSCLVDDCSDSVIEDNSTVAAAKVLNDKRPDAPVIAVIWESRPTSEVSFEAFQVQSNFHNESDYTTQIKPTTVLLT